MLRLRMHQAVRALACLGFAGLCVFGAVSGAQAETRRAFVLGVQRYSDSDIQSLTRSDADAADIAGDLEDLGFDKKNVTLATDLRTKDDFDKKFQAFLKTIQEGDDVVFFFFRPRRRRRGDQYELSAVQRFEEPQDLHQVSIARIGSARRYHRVENAILPGPIRNGRNSPRTAFRRPKSSSRSRKRNRASLSSSSTPAAPCPRRRAIFVH